MDKQWKTAGEDAVIILFKCRECGETLEWLPRQLDNGTPVCINCDIDMLYHKTIIAEDTGNMNRPKAKSLIILVWEKTVRPFAENILESHVLDVNGASYESIRREVLIGIAERHLSLEEEEMKNFKKDLDLEAVRNEDNRYIEIEEIATDNCYIDIPRFLPKPFEIKPGVKRHEMVKEIKNWKEAPTIRLEENSNERDPGTN